MFDATLAFRKLATESGRHTDILVTEYNGKSIRIGCFNETHVDSDSGL